MNNQSTFSKTHQLHKWLYSDALPLWASRGIDPNGTGAYEALSHRGDPLSDLPRRVRIHPRQSFVFARAAKNGNPQYLRLAEDLFRFTMDRCFEPETGLLAAETLPDGSISKVSHELYDLAFILLAAAALLEHGLDIQDDLTRLKASLAGLKAQTGWFENVSCSIPRRQNPHMHLFEATTELASVTNDRDWQYISEECLNMFRNIFLQPKGLVFENFDAKWRPPTFGQRLEPGHIAEWIWLLDRYEKKSGDDSGVDLEAMFQQILSARQTGGLLRDSLRPNARTSRLWPQTEFLKAVVCLNRRGSVYCAIDPDFIVGRIFDDYLKTEIEGGWYDCRSEDGRLLSHNMPSSSFYHLFTAFSEYLEDAQQHEELACDT